MKSIVALGLLGAAATVNAHPPSGRSNKSIKKRVVDLNSFRLPAKAEYVNATMTNAEPSLKAIAREDYVSTATALVKSVLPDAEFRVVDDHYVGTNGIAHVNFKQTAHGLDIDNADFNVNVSFSNLSDEYGG